MSYLTKRSVLGVFPFIGLACLVFAFSNFCCGGAIVFEVGSQCSPAWPQIPSVALNS